MTYHVYFIESVIFLITLFSYTSSLAAAGSSPLRPVVEIEENIYHYVAANNGAEPMWSRGSTSLVRIGTQVFASGLKTLTKQMPENNCQCMLWRRDQKKKWDLMRYDPTGKTREPCPLVVFPKEYKVFMSSNPMLTESGQKGHGQAQPTIIEFAINQWKTAPVHHTPVWQQSPAPPLFTNHSYRSFAADGNNGELILFNNTENSYDTVWSFRNKLGQWTAKGRLAWPEGSANPYQAIRVAYPNVMLKNHTVHYAGVSDVGEPNEQWRSFKHRLTGSDMDYVFRHLFYTWSSDITQGKFEGWVELANRDRTGGRIWPGDLWVAPDGRVHIVWTETVLDERLRDAFFPGEKQRYEMNYAVLRNGKIELFKTLTAADEGKAGVIAQEPRFQITPDNRLFVFFYADDTDATGKRVSENRILEILQDGTTSPMTRIPLFHPFNVYFTATVRGGSNPSPILDLLGTRAGFSNTVSYARVRLY